MCWRWPCLPFACGSRLSTAVCAAWPTVWKPSVARWPNCRWSSGAAPTRPAATGTGGGRQRPLPPRRLLLLPPRPLLLARPCPRGVRELRCRWGIRRRGRAPAGVRAGFRGRPCGRGAPRTWVAPRPGWQRVDAQQHSDAGAVGGGRLGAGRTGGAAAHRDARSQDVAQGSSRGGARLCRSRRCRAGGPPGSPSPGGRCGPALFRSGAGPRRRSCAPRRSRPSCCGRSRPEPRALPQCSPLTARLPAPAPATRALGRPFRHARRGFSVAQCPLQPEKGRAEMPSARPFLRYG